MYGPGLVGECAPAASQRHAMTWWQIILNWFRRRRIPRASRIVFTFRRYNKRGQLMAAEEEVQMQFTMLATQKVAVIGSPLDTNGNPSKATLSSTVYTSSDPSVFTVAADPATPGGAIMLGVGAGTATLTETALATEPDGTTTETVQGVATIVITSAPPPPPPVAASLTFTFGTPAAQ